MELLREYALSFLGTPYVYGGNNPVSGLDCSGLCLELLRSVGLWGKNDANAQSIYDHFEKNCSWNVHGLGSLAFYGKSAKEISHVALMIDIYRVIEAGGGDSKTKTKEDAAEQNAFVRLRPVKYRGDLVAVLKPSYASIGAVSKF